jgi:carbamate kinase
LLPLLELENELIITHGNGPGVGKVLMRQALAHKQVAPMSLDICDISLVESLSSSGTIVIAG